MLAEAFPPLVVLPSEYLGKRTRPFEGQFLIASKAKSKSGVVRLEFSVLSV